MQDIRHQARDLLRRNDTRAIEEVIRSTSDQDTKRYLTWELIDFSRTQYLGYYVAAEPYFYKPPFEISLEFTTNRSTPWDGRRTVTKSIEALEFDTHEIGDAIYAAVQTLFDQDTLYYYAPLLPEQVPYPNTMETYPRIADVVNEALEAYLTIRAGGSTRAARSVRRRLDQTARHFPRHQPLPYTLMDWLARILDKVLLNAGGIRMFLRSSSGTRCHPLRAMNFIAATHALGRTERLIHDLSVPDIGAVAS